ncbi:MAG: DUF1003 domain-containing protein [Verrucomicrobiota bacterium]
MKTTESEAKVEAREVDAISRENVETIGRIQREAEGHRSVSEFVADGFAKAIGSWTFIILQSILLAAWVTANVIHVLKPWDPYPFILLNLALSFQAAYASPIIMMSQNRQARLADQRNHLALQIALLAEQEDTQTLQLLRKICEKLDIQVDGETTRGLEQSTNPETLIRQIKEVADKTEKR